jgi:glycopeptide antibiotics resistance protein
MMLPIALLVGFMNETAQFLLMVIWGFSYRVVDINDVILNTIGVLIGYILFLIVTWSLRGIVKVFRIKPSGIIEYIVETGKKSKKMQVG